MSDRAPRERRSLKYIRLAAHLAALSDDVDRVTLSLAEVEDIVGDELPRAARFPSWWRNDDRRMHSRAWLAAGWNVASALEDGQDVVFERAAR